MLPAADGGAQRRAVYVYADDYMILRMRRCRLPKLSTIVGARRVY